MCLSYTYCEIYFIFFFLLVSTSTTRMKSSCKMVLFWLSNMCPQSIQEYMAMQSTQSTEFKILYFLTLKSGRKHCLNYLKKKRLLALLLGLSLPLLSPLLSFFLQQQVGFQTDSQTREQRSPASAGEIHERSEERCGQRPVAAESVSVSCSQLQ